MIDLESTIEQIPKPQLTREELERKKIELEIKDLERPFWKRPVYVLAALPTMLAVVTLSVGLLNGYFSASLTKLENQKQSLEVQKHDLETEIKAFEARRSELHLENESLKEEKHLLEEKIRAQIQVFDRTLAEKEYVLGYSHELLKIAERLDRGPLSKPELESFIKGKNQFFEHVSFGTRSSGN